MVGRFVPSGQATTIRSALAAVAMLLVAHAGPAAAACTDLMLRPSPARPARDVTAEDLVALRDIGYPDSSIMTGPSALALSPDGRSVAFVLTRADPETNGYCRALVVVPVAGGAARVIDTGGELITLTDVQRKLFVPGGFPALITPAWSPDGGSIAYLRRDHGVTQAWRARADGSGAEAVTRSAADVEAVAWSGDGRRLLYAARPGKLAKKAEADAEARSGWLYDDRVVTYSGPQPQIREADAPLVVYAIDPADHRAGEATDAERQLFAAVGVASLTAGSQTQAPDGTRAWSEHVSANSHSPVRLHVRDAGGRERPCTAPQCTGGIIGLWWRGDGRTLRILRREGWRGGTMAIYDWRPGDAAPARLYATDNLLIGCLPSGDRLLCLEENSTTPRHVALIDPAKGRSAVVFDPNPEFAHFRLGTVRRLKWRNDRGLEAWGDLVLPPGHRPGTRLPMIVVQYHSDGFLRGGTGDEYPIFPFAARGFAVLSVERPDFASSLVPGLNDQDEVVASDYKDWSERRNLLSSLVTGVRMAIDQGVADPARIGITGLSDGSTTVRFALINTRLFAAASISTCCLEPKTVMTYGGIAWADYNRRMGFPLAIRDDPHFWAPMSLAQNARDIDVPLLMQLDDDEYLIALEAFEALREYGKPVEMYVFPGEYHYKWQPEHRLAIYRRNLDWFDFWLRGVKDPAPSKAAQYRRWEAWRAGGNGLSPDVRPGAAATGP